jgi:hypothetical protein
MRKTLRTCAAGIAAAMMFMQTAFAITLPADAERHWAADEIGAAMDNGYIYGYPDGTFRPNQRVTRAEFASLVNRAKGYGYSMAASSVSYNDVDSRAWYCEDVAVAKIKGYMIGYGDGTFRPEDSISREETAVVLSRLYSGGDAYYDISRLADCDDISDWAKSAVAKALSVEMYHNVYGYLYPQNAMTRAETVKAINIMAGISADAGYGKTNITGVTLTRTGAGILNVKFASGLTTLYWVVLADNAQAPSPDQIMAGRNAANAAAVRYGSVAASKGEFTVTGLSDTGKYELYLVAASSANTAYAFSEIYGEGFSLADYFRDSYGGAWLRSLTTTNVGDNYYYPSYLYYDDYPYYYNYLRTDATALSTVSGTLYYAVFDSYANKSNITASAVRNGLDASGRAAALSGSAAVSANVSKTFPLNGLVPGLTYTVCACVFTDGGNYSNVMSNTFVATYAAQGDVTGWTVAVSASSVTADSATLYARANGYGTLYYAVFPEDNGRPTLADIRAGRDRYGIPAEKSGNIQITADITSGISLTGLNPRTTYVVYYAATGHYGETYVGGPVKFTTTAPPSYTLNSVSFVGDGFSKTIYAFPEKTVYLNSVPAFLTSLAVTANYVTADGNPAVLTYREKTEPESDEEESAGEDEFTEKNEPITSGAPVAVSDLSRDNKTVKLTINGDVYTFVLNYPTT